MQRAKKTAPKIAAAITRTATVPKGITLKDGGGSPLIKFCPLSGTIVEPITSGQKLVYRSVQIGTEYDADNEDALLVSHNLGTVLDAEKHKHTLHVTAIDPVNTKVIYPEGCHNCKELVIAIQCIGVEKKVMYVCKCGHQWYQA